MFKAIKFQRGFTLVEVLIGTALMAMVFLGIFGYTAWELRW